MKQMQAVVMKKILLGVALVTPLILASSHASAKLIELTGDFGADGRLITPTPPTAPEIKGSWSLLYDDARVPSGGGVIEVDLTALELLPNPLGGTLFDVTNTGALLTFFGSGQLGQVDIGGLLDGAVDNFKEDVADFRLGYSGSGRDLRSAFWVLPGEGIVSSFSGGGEFTISVLAVPEPATLGLLGFGLLGLGIAKRRKSSRIIAQSGESKQKCTKSVIGTS